MSDFSELHPEYKGAYAVRRTDGATVTIPGLGPRSMCGLGLPSLRGADLRGLALHGADLRGVDLLGADLSGATLTDADLSGADLRDAVLDDATMIRTRLHRACLAGASMRRIIATSAEFFDATADKADLRSASLICANMRGMVLRSADLRGADLQSADLRRARFVDAFVAGVHWPAPTMVLLANWGQVSPDLCALLMRYDESNVPDGRTFAKWANGGQCPYATFKVSRAADFVEQREDYNPMASLLPAYELMRRLLAEKCDLTEYPEASAGTSATPTATATATTSTPTTP